jgi:hypothetical protein
MIYRDHKSESRSYDALSMFGMRPPELVGVLQHSKTYICLCYVDQRKMISDADHANLLNSDIRKCRWVTLFSKRVYIRINVIDEVLRLVESNLAYLNGPDNMSGPRTSFYCQSNQAIKTLIRIYKADDADLNEDDLQFKHEHSKDFFFDGLSMPPVSVPINIHPKNAQIFFIHFLLLHERHITEIDVLHHSSPREMLQSAQLIDRSTDDHSLQNYFTNLLHLYIKEELVFLPNSMRKTDMFIP